MNNLISYYDTAITTLARVGLHIYPKVCTSEVVFARLQQNQDMKKRIQQRSVTFFTTNKTVFAAIAAALFVWHLVGNFQEYKYNSLLSKHQAEVKEAQELNVWFQKHPEQLPVIRNAAIDALATEHHLLLMKTRLESDAARKTALSVENEIQKNGDDGDYRSSFEKFHQDLEELKQSKFQLEKKSQDIASIEATTNDLKEFEVKNQGLIEDQPLIAEAVQALKTLLNTPGAKWGDIRNSEKLLKDRSMKAGTVKQRLELLDAKKAHILSFKLPPADVELVNQLFDRNVLSIKSLDFSDTSATKHFDFLAKFVGIQLEMRVTPDGKGKSGVERTFEGSGGKSWYIIASAVTAGTDTVEMFLRNRETGQFTEVTKFGVKVSQDKYKAVGIDIKDDGVVTDNLLAIKPVGSLHFNPEIGVEIDFITRW